MIVAQSFLLKKVILLRSSSELLKNSSTRGAFPDDDVDMMVSARADFVVQRRNNIIAA